MRIRRLLLAASLLLAGPAFGQLPRPGVSIPASKVSISGYTNTDLQSGLSEGEIASIRPAADCTLVDGGKPNEICRDTDDQTLWICTNATECNHADWVAHGGGGGGSGDITNVGPGYSDGAAFTDGKASTGSTMFIWEGTSVDSNELSILSPSANPGADIAITLPSATSTLLGSVTAVAPATGTPSSTTFLRGDGTWSTPSSGAATSLDSSQTGTTYDVKFGSATSPSTGWYYDIDGDGVVDEGEQLALPNRSVFTVTTLTGAGIQAAVTACGATVPCEIRLVPGTYTDVCLQIKDKDQGIRLVGAGQGITILKPYADADDCVATLNLEMIEINGSHNVEISDLTIEGDKVNQSFPTCANTQFCGNAIVSNSLVPNFSNNLWIHDITVQNFMGNAVYVQHSKHALIEKSTFTNLGCHQTDNICGNGAGHLGWDAAPDLATVGQKTKGAGVVAGAPAEDVIIRDNVVTNTTYNGIEAYDGGGSGCGTGSASGCVSRVEVAHNVITQAQQGLSINGGEYLWFHDNVSYGNRATNGAGDTGSGMVVAANSTSDVRIEDNKFYDNTSAGLTVKPIDGGNIVVARNRITNNCLDHTNGSNLHILSSGGTQAKNITVEDNVIAQGFVPTGVSPTFGCVYTLEAYGGANDYLGHVTILGNTVLDAGSSGPVNLSAGNMFVHGLTVTGNVIFGATASGFTLENTISGTTSYFLGSSMTRLDAGVMGISAGTSSGQLQLFEPSGGGSPNHKATFVVPALAADTNYTLPTTDGAASEFLQTNGSGVLTWAAPAGAGTITGVGPAFTTGLAFTDGTASTSNVMLVWEGSTVDTNEFTLLAPCTTCNSSDINITFPATTGTLVGTGDTGGVTSAMITDDEIDVADIFNASTLASNPGYAANEVWFGSTGLIFEGTAANNIEGLLTAATITTADKTWTLPDATGTIVVTPVPDGGLIDLSAVSVTAATEGILLPQHATTCASATAEGQICWEADANHLWVGDGAAAVDIGPGGGSGDVTAVGNCASGDCFTGASGTTLSSNTNLLLNVDNDNNTSNTFTVANGAGATLLQVDETGNALVESIEDTTGPGTNWSISSAGAAVFASTVTAASFTASPSPEPTMAFRDSNNADAEDSAVLVANCSVTTSTNEDCDVYLKQAVDGGTNGTISGNTMKTVISSIADGAGTIGSDQNTSWTITTDGTGDAELVVPTGSISGLEILDATITYSDVSHTETLAGNPANGASAAWWGTTGIIFEGSTSDASELLLTAADPAADVTLTLPASTGTLPVIIAQGTVALDTDAIASTACDTSDTAISATGTLSTDVLSWSFNADITAITGYAPATTGALIIYAYPSADAVNFKVCNPTTSSITPGSAVTLNWKVIR